MTQSTTEKKLSKRRKKLFFVSLHESQTLKKKMKECNIDRQSRELEKHCRNSVSRVNCKSSYMSFVLPVVLMFMNEFSLQLERKTCHEQHLVSWCLQQAFLLQISREKHCGELCNQSNLSRSKRRKQFMGLPRIVRFTVKLLRFFSRFSTDASFVRFTASLRWTIRKFLLL